MMDNCYHCGALTAVECQFEMFEPLCNHCERLDEMKYMLDMELSQFGDIILSDDEKIKRLRSKLFGA